MIRLKYASSFAFDSERPRHKVFLAPHQLAGRRVTNGEWRNFIADDGYKTSTLWLSDDFARQSEPEAQGRAHAPDSSTGPLEQRPRQIKPPR